MDMFVGFLQGPIDSAARAAVFSFENMSANLYAKMRTPTFRGDFNERERKHAADENVR
jgi:hypothetical protein